MILDRQHISVFLLQKTVSTGIIIMFIIDLVYNPYNYLPTYEIFNKLRMHVRCIVSDSQYTHMSQCQTHHSMENELCLVANQEELFL